MMKTILIAVALLGPLAACATDAADPVPPVPEDPYAYRIEVPAFTLQPGEEKFYCYYTTLPVAADTGVKSYSSSMTTGSHHMLLFFAPESTEPDGTLGECTMFGGAGSARSIPVIAYGTQNAESTQDMPDGVGVALKANQAVVVNMHYYNTSEAPITATVTIDVHTYAPEVTYIPARSYITFNTEINIPPRSPAKVAGTCDVPAGSNFIYMSTHSHKYTTSARVLDGSHMVIETKDWEHATADNYSEPYLQFASNKLTYQCDYYNPTDDVITVGESAATNEMCMATGFFFPSDKDVICLNSQVVSF